MRQLAGIQVETVQVFARNSDETFESPAWKPTRCCGFGWMQSPQFAEGTWQLSSLVAANLDLVRPSGPQPQEEPWRDCNMLASAHCKATGMTTWR